MYKFKKIFTIKGMINSILIFIVIILCGCNIVYNTIPSVAENFIGEWTAINPTVISKVKIHSFGNKIIVHEWKRGNTELPKIMIGENRLLKYPIFLMVHLD